VFSRQDDMLLRETLSAHGLGSPVQMARNDHRWENDNSPWLSLGLEVSTAGQAGDPEPLGAWAGVGELVADRREIPPISRPWRLTGGVPPVYMPASRRRPPCGDTLFGRKAP